MILDASKYRINLPAIVTWRTNRPGEPLMDAMSLMAVAYGIPIIVLAHYMGELYGYTDELTDFIYRLMVFYRVDEVKGLPPVKDLTLV